MWFSMFESILIVNNRAIQSFFVKFTVRRPHTEAKTTQLKKIDVSLPAQFLKIYNISLQENGEKE